MIAMETFPPRFTAGVSLEIAIESLLKSKAAGNLRPRYLASLRAYLRAFARGREGRPVSELDVFTLEDWFASRSESPTTMASNLGRLASLFSFCARRGWIEKNPTQFIEKPRIERAAPKILTPEQAHQLIRFVRDRKPHALPYFTLALHGGVRPEELERLTWASVDLPRGIVIVDAAASKVRRRRIVELHPVCRALLFESQGRGGRLPIGRESRRRFLGWAAELLGFETWPQDCLRHSAASYLLALHRDAAKVALWLGNSPGILGRHYLEIVRAEDAEKFWTL